MDGFQNKKSMFVTENVSLLEILNIIRTYFITRGDGSKTFILRKKLKVDLNEYTYR